MRVMVMRAVRNGKARWNGNGVHLVVVVAVGLVKVVAVFAVVVVAVEMVVVVVEEPKLVTALVDSGW